jgi:hypothetical protein
LAQFEILKFKYEHRHYIVFNPKPAVDGTAKAVDGSGQTRSGKAKRIPPFETLSYFLTWKRASLTELALALLRPTIPQNTCA